MIYDLEFSIFSLQRVEQLFYNGNCSLQTLMRHRWYNFATSLLQLYDLVAPLVLIFYLVKFKTPSLEFYELILKT